MLILASILLFLLLSSLSLNVFHILKLKKVKARPQSVDLREFVADITGGVGFLAISRVDPESFVLRSPRQHR